MKRKVINMNKIIKSLIVLSVIAMGSSASAADVTVSATVNASLSITTTTNVAFGGVIQGTNGVLDPQGTNSGLGAGATLGKLTVAGTGTAACILTFSESSTNLSDGTNTMAFVPDFAGYGTDAPTSAVDLNTGAVVNLVGSAYYVYVGGTLTVAADQVVGNYTAAAGGGNLTVTIAYQ